MLLDRSFCSPELLELLRVSGSDTKVTLETMTGVKPEEARELSLCIQGTGGGRSRQILQAESVLCMPSFPDLLNCQVSADMASSFSHLRDIPLPSISRGVVLLLGQDVPRALTPLEVRITGVQDEPHAFRTELGWAVAGPFRNAEPQSPACNLVKCPGPVHPLLNQVEKFWKLDVLVVDKVEPSIEHRAVAEKWDTTIKNVAGKF